MNKKIIYGFILIIFAVCLFTGTALASSNGLVNGYGIDGTTVNAGTQSNPYAINDFADLQAISSYNWGNGVYYEQTANITLQSSVSISFSLWGSGSFIGNYNGGGYAIDGDNLYYIRISGNGKDKATIANVVFMNIYLGQTVSPVRIAMFTAIAVSNSYFININFGTNVEMGGLESVGGSGSYPEGCKFENCIVYNFLASTGTTSSPTNKNKVTTFLGGYSDSTAYKNGYVTNCVVIGGGITKNGAAFDTKRIAWSSKMYLSNNYATNGGDSASGENGLSITSTQYNDKTWWENTAGYDMSSSTAVWEWDTDTQLPKLRHSSDHPHINNIGALKQLSYISEIVTSTVNATPGIEGDHLSYQWQLLTPGNNWSNITNQTTNELTYTVDTPGLNQFKVIVTEIESGLFKTSNIISTTVIQSYNPQSVTSKISSIQAKTSDNYQAIQEYDFDDSANISDAEWISNDAAYIAAGNAIYEVSGDTFVINPVSSWTGNAISKAYLGNTRAIINDVDNNVAVYTYSTHSAQYIAQNGSNALAVTGNYAGIVQNGMLNIYNNSLKIQASVSSAAPFLVANDVTDIFAYYSGRTVYYYVINGNTVTQMSSTPVPTSYTITSLQQIRGTDNWLITSEYQTPGSGSPKTYVIKITAAGVLSTILTSTDSYPLSHAQATESNLIIGIDKTVTYVIGADGTTQGSYTTGGTLNDASIAKGNGLYAIVGGNDNQAYFLNKYASSNWVLGQTTNFLETVYHTQISNDGTFALIGTAHKFFLFKWDETIESTYFINGVVVGSDGLPYANKYITIDSNAVLTDDSGFFVYPVKPGQTYTIITGTKTTRYTATNQALQTLSIKMTSQLIAQDVTYGINYNSTSKNIEMNYKDAADKTSVVVWSVRNTKTGQEVSRQSVTPGQTAFYAVPNTSMSDNYFVTVNADRGNTTVKNTWSVTPSGQGQSVNLFGMDDTGKNILFGFFIILLAGLFGYMHQHIGTIIVAFAAAILRYLGLITVPWIMIIIAVVVSIVAAIAHRGEGK